MPKRPRDFSQAAKFVVDVATGVQAEEHQASPWDRFAVLMSSQTITRSPWETRRKRAA
jgi:hypothetical protein